MSGNAYDAYKAGVIAGSLAIAQEALNAAYVQTMGLSRLGDPDSLVSLIERSQDTVRAARKLESSIAQDAMSGR